MIFTSLDFLIFYALLMGLLLVVNNQLFRSTILLLASYFFYAWWNPTFILLLFVSSLWSWSLGLLIHKADSEKKKSIYLTISLLLSLGMLAYYKYAQFLMENIAAMLGYQRDYQFDIILPVGISFFTFQTMSYCIDLRRGNIEVCKSLPQLMLFVAFFPQLVAGPVVRASELLPQLKTNNIVITPRNVIIGLQIFLGGALQKVLVADNLSVFVDPVFADHGFYSAETLWLALLAYTLQIFCDFSGYSLMAIGIAKTLGFELPKNFDMPYVSRSVTEFWRRWHMTLSFWLRDYLYISLGGNRKGHLRTYAHLYITMLLGGLWHGASWNFVLWGALHGGALACHKLWLEYTESWVKLKAQPTYIFVSWGLTFLFVMLTWIPFRCADFSSSYTYFLHMLGAVPAGIQWLNPNVLLVLFATLVWHLIFIFKQPVLARFPAENITTFYPQLTIFVGLLFIVMFAPVSSSPFIYFQF
ncbi:MAG: membrane-bound O-acyltransferase family protein [Pseudomonadales bacterium]|nr:membrane-bound O-acyltransferase family protein [Pseudomonadales bacterium]